MDLEVDSMFTGLCSAVIVCVVSVVLYFMFKRAVFTPARSVTSLLDAVSSKKRSKKLEIKKAKKVKKHKHAGESGDPLEQERAQTSEETVDDDDSVSTDELEKKVLDLNSFTTKTDEGAVDNKVSKRIDNDHIQVPSDTLKNMEIKTIQVCEVEQSSCPPVSTVPLDKLSEVVDIVQPAGVAVTDSCEESFPVADFTQKASVSSKRTKKRSGKRTTEPSKLASNPLGTVQPSEVITKSTIVEATFAERIHPTSDALLTEAQEELRKLTDQLRASDQKLQEVAHHATRLSEENERLRAKEEEQTLGLHVLQNEYRELLRTNKSIEHDKHLKEVKLQTLETERTTLRARLDQTKAESGRLQTEADREIRELRDQLTEGKAKLASMAAAMASAPPPGPSPELVRAQEMTQAVSKENCLLKSRLEQLEGEINQLRQANVIHQQEIQAFRVEAHKLQSEKETALEELRAKRQNEQADAKSRIAGYEAQIQRQHHELEIERKRSQELMMSLNGSQNELTRCLEHQKHQSEVISSLEYQFAELNAQKQRLFDEVTQSMSLNESTVNELRAQVAQLSSDLTRVTAELQEAQHRADNLKNELDAARLGKSLNDVTTATATVAATTTTSTSPCLKQCTDAGVCTEFVLLLDRRAGDVKSSTPSSHVQPSVWVDLESKVALDQLREQLSATQDRYKKTVRERNEARKQQKASVAELQRYKNTLMETEYLLAKLQEFVGESERKWRQLLTESENERNQLAARLGESNKKTQEVTKKLKETERKLAGGKEPPNRNLCGKIKKTGGQRSKKAKPQLAPHEDPILSGTMEFTGSEVVAPHMDGITSIQVASPTCADDVETSFIEAVTAENDHRDPEMMGTSKDVNSVHRNAQKPHIGETPSTLSKNLPTTCDVVDDTWIAVAPSLALDGDNGPCPASNDLLYVSARPVSGARWTSSVQDIETAQLAPPLGLDTDNDSDAVVVDDTDLHVPDDIWDSVTKPTENSPADSIPTDVPDENSAASVDQSEIPPIPQR